MGRIFGSSTLQESAGITPAMIKLPNNCIQLLVRASISNTDNVYIKIDDVTADTNDIILRAGEYISFDISDSLHLKNALGCDIETDDFFRMLAYASASGTQDVEIDAFGINIPVGKRL